MTTTDRASRRRQTEQLWLSFVSLGRVPFPATLTFAGDRVTAESQLSQDVIEFVVVFSARLYAKKHKKTDRHFLISATSAYLIFLRHTNDIYLAEGACLID